jgi:hypothetical protein
MNPQWESGNHDGKKKKKMMMMTKASQRGEIEAATAVATS